MVHLTSRYELALAAVWVCCRATRSIIYIYNKQVAGAAQAPIGK